MRNVLIVSTVGMIYGGISGVILSYLQNMKLNGLNIFIAVTFGIDSSIKLQLEKIGCKIIFLPNRKKEPINYLYSLIKFIRKSNIEVIHAHGNSGTLAIEMFAGLLGGCSKRIAHSHNTQCSQVLLDKLFRPFFYSLYTDGLACGEAAGKWLFDNRKFLVLPNARDLEKYKFLLEVRSLTRKRYGMNNRMVIGHVGGFFEQKNHMFLVDIYRELRKLEPDCFLVMIGDGPLRAEVEKKCENLGVIFTGAVDNVQDYLNAMDGMLLPSFFEGIPLVALEWQINGLPSVLSDNVSSECVLTDFVRQLSLNESAEQWARHILDMIKTYDRAETSFRAYQKIKKSSFDIKKSTEILRSVYLGEK